MTTSTTTETTLLSASELLRLYSKGVRGELIRGGTLRNHADGT